MLSEKMKGKRRVLEPEPITPASSSSRAGPEQEIKNSKRDLVIRFTEGAPDLTVQVEQEDSVKDIKTNIRGARPDLADRRLRLIHAGRILPDTTYVYDWLYSLEERQKRATGYKEEDSTAPAPPQHHGTVIWMHCSVGPKLEPGEESQEERQQTAQLQPARGFDRLAAVGFSEEDIANFRRQFHSQSSSNYLDIDFDTEEEYDEHARALEEQWIDSLDNGSTASLSQSGDTGNSNMLQGILVGFFFPVLPFFFMRSQKPATFWDDGSEPEPPANVIFSRQMQMGIVVGFLANLLFGVWRYFLDSS